MTTSGVLDEVYHERDHQNAKWGEQNHNDFIWTAILGEEVGETAQQALWAHFDNDEPKGPGNANSVREELIQVAAVAVAWIECIDRRVRGVGS